MVEHHGYVARGLVAACAALHCGPANGGVGCVFRGVGRSGSYGDGGLPRGRGVPGGLVIQTHQPEGNSHALYYLLRQFCARLPEVLRRAQVLGDVDNQSVVGGFNRGRARNREAHALLVQLFELQIEYDFMLSLRWVPTEANGMADAISRPSRETTVRVSPAAFERVWREIGPFTVDLMACTASALRPPGAREPLPLLSRHDCQGSVGVNVFAQDVSVMPGGAAPAFGFCFPPPVMAEHVAQHLAECKEHAVLLVPDVPAYWFSLVQRAAVRSVTVASRTQRGCFQWPSPHGSLKPRTYTRWGMIAYDGLPLDLVARRPRLS